MVSDKWTLRSLLPALLLGLTGAAEVRNHPGLAIVGDTKEPLVAQVSAYGSDRRLGAEGDCPKLESYLVSTTSASDGRFQLRVASAAPSYYVVLCSAGYFPRVEGSVTNGPDGSPLLPYPITLIARETPFEPYRKALSDETDAFISNMRYLRDAARASFPDAIGFLQSRANTEEERRFYSSLQQLLAMDSIPRKR